MGGVIASGTELATVACSDESDKRGLNQIRVNSSYSTDGGHFPELLLW